MNWIDKQMITKGVIDMLGINMGVHDRERILVVTDILDAERWPIFSSVDLEPILRRSYLAHLVADIAQEAFAACRTEFYAFNSTCQPGKEPPAEAAKRFKETDVLIAIVSFSLSHTNARGEASRAGVRVASMPRFIPEMFYPGGPMAVNYQAIATETRVIADLITDAEEVTVRSPHGTNITFSVKGRVGQSDNGMYTHPGAWGNLPAGEAYTSPLEGIGRGQVVVRKGWLAGLNEADMVLRFEEGEVVWLEGGGELGRKLANFLDLPTRGASARARRILAELGVGTNPNARRTDITLEAEKIKGTVHIAIGDGSHMGGKNVADFHQDYVIPEADLILDGKVVMQGGKFVF